MLSVPWRGATQQSCQEPVSKKRYSSAALTAFGVRAGLRPIVCTALIRAGVCTLEIPATLQETDPKLTGREHRSLRDNVHHPLETYTQKHGVKKMRNKCCHLLDPTFLTQVLQPHSDPMLQTSVVS